MAGVQGIMMAMLTIAISVSVNNGQTLDPCDIVCTALPSTPQACGSDGRTYANECTLNVARDCRDPDLHLVSYGPCIPTPTPCNMACSAVNDPVCGSDGHTYINSGCLNAAAQCGKPGLYKNYDGPCVQTTTPCATPGCLPVYDPVCGTDGRTYDNDCILQGAKCNNPSLELAYRGACNCDTPCPEYYSPVCGSDGVTYGNICFLNVAICRNPYLKWMYDGKCRDGGDNCDKYCNGHYQPVCGTNRKQYDSYCLFEIDECRYGIRIWKFSTCSSGVRTTCPSLFALVTLLASLLLVLPW